MEKRMSVRAGVSVRVRARAIGSFVCGKRELTFSCADSWSFS